MNYIINKLNSFSKEEKIRFLFYLIIFCLLYAIVHSIYPLADDWYYLCSPNTDPSLSDLLPTERFWRPFDALIGMFLGKFPQLFPILNRLLVVAAHVMNGYLLGLIMEKMGIKITCKRLSVCIFLFSSMIWAVISSPDALNQGFSVLFGLIALWVNIKKRGYYYLIPCLLALFWKESGVSWFFVVPLFDILIRGNSFSDFCRDTALLKKVTSKCCASFFVILIYFIMRFALLGSITLGYSDGTYKISIISFSTLKNLCMLLVSATTGIDTIAMFGTNRSWILVGLTTVLSLVFLFAGLIYALKSVKKNKNFFQFFCLLLCAFGLAAPLAILGQAGEMHSYPVLCAMSLLWAFVLNTANVNFKKFIIPVLCLFIAFSISSTHKIYSLYQYSSRTQIMDQKIKNVYKYTGDKVLFVVVDNKKGYSIYDQTSLYGTANGESMRQYLGWPQLKHSCYDVGSKSEASEYVEKVAEEYSGIYIVVDENVTRIK